MAASASKSDYYRIELDYPVDIDEIASLTLPVYGANFSFAPQSTNSTGGVEYRQGIITYCTNGSGM